MAERIAKFALYLSNAFLGGFVGACFWGWFVVSLGAPVINPFHVMGLQVMFDLFAIKMSDVTTALRDKEEVTVDARLTMTGCLLVMWVMGWLISLGV